MPSAIRRRTSGFISLWCMPCPIHIPGRRRRTAASDGLSGRAAEPHALERPLDGPAGAGEVLREIRHVRSTTSIRIGPVSDCAIVSTSAVAERGIIGKQRPDVSRRATVADQAPSRCHARSVASRSVRRVRAARRCDQNPSHGDRARSTHRGCHPTRASAPPLRRARKAQSAQFQRRRKSERTIDRGARRRRIEPGREALFRRGLEAGVEQSCRKAAAAPALR